MEPFQGVSIYDFMERFKTEEDCLSYLAYHKWTKNDFACAKCGHTEAWDSKKPYTKVCKSCRKIESASANTHFHKVKFGLKKAFLTVFEMTTTTKSISGNQMSKRLGIKYDAAWLFMRKVRDVMESSCQYPLTGDVIVDEFVIGGYEKGAVGRKTDSKKMKVVVVIEIHKNIGIKRGYALIIEDYSSKELRKIFDKHIDKSANVLTDKWKGYLPLMKDYSITQEESEGGKNFVPMNRFIQGLKSWVRGIHHHVDRYHVQAYLNEYCYRFNRNFSKDCIFDETIERMVLKGPTNRNKLSQIELPTYEERQTRIMLELMVKGELGKVA